MAGSLSLSLSLTHSFALSQARKEEMAGVDREEEERQAGRQALDAERVREVEALREDLRRESEALCAQVCLPPSTLLLLLTLTPK